MQRAIFRPPAIVFKGRHHSSEEIVAIAEGWLDVLLASMPPAGGLTALPLSNHPEAVALFFALSSLPFPVIVLPAEPQGLAELCTDPTRHAAVPSAVTSRDGERGRPPRTSHLRVAR